MSDLYPALKVTRKTGLEQFMRGEEPAGFDLLGFWQWACSDLVGNAWRGVLAEYIVGSALGVVDDTRIEWASFDLVTSTGIKVEVKSGAHIQSWYQKRLSPITFTISPTRAWDATTGLYETESRRQADVYVFCVLAHKEQVTLNPLDLRQWEFYVTRASKLNETLPSQKTLSLAGLLRLHPTKVPFEDLRASIEACGAERNKEESRLT